MNGKTSFSEPSSPLSHRDLAKLDIKSPLFRSTPILQPIASRPIHFLHNARSQTEWLQPRRSRLERLEENSSLENSGHSGGLPFLSRPFSPLAGRTGLTGKASPGLPWRSSSSSSASSPEFVVPGPSRSPLLGQELEQAQATSIMFSPHSSIRGAPSPRSFHTLSSVAPSPNPQSPPSATALSATEMHAPRQMHALHVSTSPLPREFPAPGSHVASSVGSILQHLTRHSTFYFSPDMVVLRVEDTLYRLHWDQLRKHTTYFDELILAQEAGWNSRHLVGKTDETALHIPNVTQPAFDVLLYFLHDGIFEQEKVTLKDWITLLAVSSQLNFEKIRSWAIKRISEQLPDIEPVAIVVLATRYDVPQWLTSAYTTLCTRETALADEEAEELGATTTARIARTREAILEEKYRIFRECVFPNDVEQKLGKLDITRMIKHAFPQAAGAAGVSGLL